MNAVAERYVHLVLALGQHDPDYVDAFYGPAEWKTHDAISAERPLFPHITLAPKVRTITHLSPRFLRRSIKTN